MVRTVNEYLYVTTVQEGRGMLPMEGANGA
jgi:hypothetical protein